MTREEAIYILDNLKPTNTKSSFDAYVVGEAITMAIKALEQGDVLQEIRQEIAEYHAHNGNGDDRSIDCRLFNVGIQIALEIIDDMIKELSE